MSRLAGRTPDLKKILDDEGLFAEFIAAALGASADDRRRLHGEFRGGSPLYVLDRSKRAIDIANMIGTCDIVLWLARVGTYIREAKCPIESPRRILDAVNTLLAHDKNIRILGEMKPNEPMDQAYLPTPGHFLALCYKSADPKRCGVLIRRSAHSILAGLGPIRRHGLRPVSREALERSFERPEWTEVRPGQIIWVRPICGLRASTPSGCWSGAKYDGCIGLDVKAMRTTKPEHQVKHLANSRAIFLRLVEVARSIDASKVERLRAERDYESLELYIVEKLLGK